MADVLLEVCQSTDLSRLTATGGVRDKGKPLPIRRFSRIALLLAAYVMTITAVQSEPTAERMVKSVEKWWQMASGLLQAFRCAALAEAAGTQPADILRLFDKGLERGRPLLRAAFENRFSLSGDAVILPQTCVFGPTAEFALGGLWQCAVHDLQPYLPDDPVKRVAEATYLYNADKCAAL